MSGMNLFFAHFFVFAVIGILGECYSVSVMCIQHSLV